MSPRSAQDDFGEEKNLFPLPGFELRTIRPVAGRYNTPPNFL
jgi:hypothetical protein